MTDRSNVQKIQGILQISLLIFLTCRQILFTVNMLICLLKLIMSKPRKKYPQ